MKDSLQTTLKELIFDSLLKAGFALEPKEEICLDFPTDSRFGELSTNIALRLARAMKKSPREIALPLIALLKEGLVNAGIAAQVKEVKLEGAGFINFYLSENYFYEQLEELLRGGPEALRRDLGQGQPVLIEFVSANPTGPLSVAHARQAVVGDVLANIFSFLGYEVSREYYLNDEGNQINILGRSVELRLKELGGEVIEFPEDHYQGEYIYDIARKMQAAKSKVSNSGDFAAEYILDIIKKELVDFGVNFDCWYSQKQLGVSGKIAASLALLKEKGFLFEDGGAVWFKSTQFGDDKDRVVVKSDGSYTYLAPDIAYHLEKYARGYKKLINLWGPDHHGYINRLKAAVSALGHEPGSLSIVIVQLATIFRGAKPLLMSTRRGQYITLREVIEEVGVDAARFFFLMRRTSSHLDFDLETAKAQTPENPVYYCQYAYARIGSILRNSPFMSLPEKIGFSVLKEKEELALIKKIWQFNTVLEICVITEDPYLLTVYLQELAESFHKFYDLYRVLGNAEDLTLARLELIRAVQVVIGTAFGLLGVSRPEKM